MADNTTKVGSPDAVINAATSLMRSTVPTEVPPNFITFIFFLLYFIIRWCEGARVSLSEAEGARIVLAI